MLRVHGIDLTVMGLGILGSPGIDNRLQNCSYNPVVWPLSRVSQVMLGL